MTSVSLPASSRLISSLLSLACFFFASGCGSPVRDKTTPRARAGVLDLRQWNFTRDGNVKLKGDWEFHPGVFLDGPTNKAKAEATDFLEFPGLWQGTRFRGKQLKRTGFATYRLTILLPEEREMLALRLVDLYTSYRLMVDDRTLVLRGLPGKSRARTVPARGPPAITTFQPTRDRIVLTLHIANFHHRNGGPRQALLLGIDDTLRVGGRNALTFEVFLCGILLMLGIYNLVLFVVRRKERSTLYFALFTWMFMLRTLVLGEMYLIVLLENLPWAIHTRLIYISSYLAAFAFAGFIYEVFPDIFARKVLNLSRVFLPGLAGITLLIPARFNSWLFPGFEVFMAGIALYVTWVFFRAVFLEREDGLMYLAGWLLFFFAIFNDILKNHELLDTVFLMPAGICVMVVSQAILLSRKISRAFIASEKLSDILEDRVTRRTRELAEARDAAQGAHREIERLNEFSKKLNTSADLDDVLRRITDYIAAHFDQDSTWLWLVDTDRNELYAHKMNYRYTRLPEETREFFSGLRLPLKPQTGSLYQTWKRGRYLNVRRLREKYMTPTDRMIAERLELKNFLHVPLKVQGVVIGIFSLTKAGEESFQRDEIAFITRFCEQITGAVYSSSLLLEVRAAREKSEASRVELAAARDRAEESNRAKTEFLTTMSHEIRTPLNSIIGTADLLKETELSREQGRFVEILNRAGRNLLNLINEILDLARLEAGKLRMEKEPFELEEVRRNILSVMRVRAQSRGLKIVWRRTEGIPRILLGDAGRLEQVLLNLLGNAVKFTEAGRIEVDLRRTESDDKELVLEFAIRDSGVGIPEDKLESIFERFTQVDSSITRKYGGTGLGLAICRRLVTLMGGEIRAESRTGRESGSTFFFTTRLGIAEESRTTGEANRRERRMPPMGTRILLAEDNPDNHYLVRAFLKDSGVVLEDAENGLRAVEMYRARAYDLVLMDIQMPIMDGYTATRAIRQLEEERGGRPTPIIALTAHASPTDIEKSLAAGCDGHLTKPIRKQTLLDEIVRFVEREE